MGRAVLSKTLILEGSHQRVPPRTTATSAPIPVVIHCHSVLQGIFPTQGLNLGLLLCRWILYHLSHQGSLMRLLGWALIQYNRCPYRRREFGHGHTARTPCEDTEGKLCWHGILVSQAKEHMRSPESTRGRRIFP